MAAANPDTSALRVDAHHHLWDLEVREQPWTATIPELRRSFSVEDLRTDLDGHPIDATVLVQTVCVADETPEMLALAAAEPLIAGVVGWVELTDPAVGERIAELRAGPGGERLVGIRHQVQEEPDPQYLARPEVRRGLRAVGDAGLVFDLLVRPHQLPASVDAARALPGVSFVLDHAGKPDVTLAPSADWRRDVAALATLPNVTAKLSGFTSEAPSWTVAALRPFVQELLFAFGPERLMFGSDWPVCLLGGGYTRALGVVEELTAALTDAERTLIFGQVATDAYGLRR